MTLPARRARAAGKNPKKKRKAGRAAGRKRMGSRRDAGLCTRCGRNPPVEGGFACEPCLVARRDADRELYTARRAAGRCGKCGGPTADGASRCAPCTVLDAERVDPDRKNRNSRRRYWKRRAARRCTDCGQPSQGAARCDVCARRSHERSDRFRGWPVYPPRFTVVPIDTDEPVATFDDEMDVAAYLAFEKLTRDRVEVIVDRSPVQTMTAWE